MSRRWGGDLGLWAQMSPDPGALRFLGLDHAFRQPWKAWEWTRDPRACGRASGPLPAYLSKSRAPGFVPVQVTTWPGEGLGGWRLQAVWGWAFCVIPDNPGKWEAPLPPPAASTGVSPQLYLGGLWGIWGLLSLPHPAPSCLAAGWGASLPRGHTACFLNSSSGGGFWPQSEVLF